MTLLTIGMPVYNDIDFIEESLLSILDQTYTNFILIISDDGSTDGSEAICRKYVDKDSRVHYIRQPKNLGISRNMEFLLTQCETPYFMWAADDDLWNPRFVDILLNNLLNNPDSVSSFCKYFEINELGEKTGDFYYPNYTGTSAYRRLLKLSKYMNDGFGYGIFKTEKIRGVKFPVWWWPNRKTPYNNIYPTLCYYLAQGQYEYHEADYLFYKRVKTENKTNHSITGWGNPVKVTFAYIIRRYNLVVFSLRLIRKSQGFSLSFRVAPAFHYNWFMKSSGQQLKIAFLSFFRNRFKAKKN